MNCVEVIVVECEVFVDVVVVFLDYVVVLLFECGDVVLIGDVYLFVVDDWCDGFDCFGWSLLVGMFVSFEVVELLVFGDYEN